MLGMPQAPMLISYFLESLNNASLSRIFASTWILCLHPAMWFTVLFIDASVKYLTGKETVGTKLTPSTVDKFYESHHFVLLFTCPRPVSVFRPIYSFSFHGYRAPMRNTGQISLVDHILFPDTC